MQTSMFREHTEMISDVTHVRKMGNSIGITIPRLVIATLDWRPGETLLAHAEGNRLVVERLVEHMALAASENDAENTPRK